MAGQIVIDKDKVDALSASLGSAFGVLHNPAFGLAIVLGATAFIAVMMLLIARRQPQR